MSLLDARGLVKTYRGRGAVVSDVSFHVGPGEIVGLLGRNGAGKTTSFRMTIGMIRPDAGAVLFLDQDVTTLPMYRRAALGMGYLSQEPSIFRNMTVEENLLAILETLPIDRAERRDRLERHLGDLGLTSLRRSVAYQLSGGERRRLEITRALVTSPKLMMLDEPFVGIDPIAVEEIQKIVLSLRARGIGIIITDHHVRETLAITDRAYIIDEGRIFRQGTSRELVDDEAVRRTYLGEKFRMPELESDAPESDKGTDGSELDPPPADGSPRRPL
jgi:lipopolysaccharide export system ATP-binding protein